MRILALADEPDKRLWEMLDKRLLEGVDLILSAGDLPGEYLSFLTCFTRAPILYVRGNHDERYDKKPPEGCVCVEDDIVTVNGVRILGLGGSMRYKPGKNMYTEREMRARIRKLRWKLFVKGGFDILLAHAPAKGLGDQDNLPHRGFECFLELMEKYRPQYMVYGHVHPEYGAFFTREYQYLDTRAVNANKRFYFDIEAKNGKVGNGQ